MAKFYHPVAQYLLLPALLVILSIPNHHNLDLRKISNFTFSSHEKAEDISGIETEIKTLSCLTVAISASLLYCLLVSEKLPKGIPRLISLIPIFCFLAILPTYLTTVLFTVTCSLCFTWLTSFKLLLFAFDQGPLASNPPKSLPVLFVIAALPINLKMKTSYPHERKPKKFPFSIGTDLLALAVLLGTFHDYKKEIAFQLRLCSILILTIDIGFGFLHLMVGAMTGLELEYPSNEPCLSTSLGEFWGRRWNRLVANSVGQTVYKPFKSAAMKLLGEDRAKLLAVLATFLVSGLMHELCLYYVMRDSPSWEVTMLFMLHGFCVVVESRLKTAVGEKWLLPWFIRGPLVIGFVIATTIWLEFAPFTKNGLDVRVCQELNMIFELFKVKLVQL